MRKLLLACALAFSVATTSGCVQLIIGGLNILQGLLPVSRDQEIAMGAAAAQQLLSSPQVRLYDNPQVLAYVQRVGMAMVRQSGRTDLPWRFYVVVAPEQNAFALPGGFVFITTGALQAMSNEAELAGVLGHEVGHVAARHGVEQIRRALVARGFLISTLGTSPQAAQIAGQIVAQIVLKGYGREAELEADRLGARYAARAGYDPRQLEAFLQVLAKQGEPPGWLMPLETHPTIADRLQNLDRTIASQNLHGNELGQDSFRTAMAPLMGGGAGAVPAR
ncbi:MAG TPA: M48 family metallopeptidase [Stenomitos sp.]